MARPDHFANPLKKVKNGRIERKKRARKLQAKGPSTALAAEAERQAYRRRCKQDKRWLHAQLQRPDSGGITKEMHRTLRAFFSLPNPESQWNTERSENGAVFRVPYLPKDCISIWERLQEGRKASMLRGWDDPYAIEADWWTKVEGHSLEKRMARVGIEDQAEERRNNRGEAPISAEGEGEDDIEVEDQDEGEDDFGVIEPIPVEAGEI